MVNAQTSKWRRGSWGILGASDSVLAPDPWWQPSHPPSQDSAGLPVRRYSPLCRSRARLTLSIRELALLSRLEAFHKLLSENLLCRQSIVLRAEKSEV